MWREVRRKERKNRITNDINRTKGRRAHVIIRGKEETRRRMIIKIKASEYFHEPLCPKD